MSTIASLKVFFKEWLRQPLKVAAIAPSMPPLGRFMAAQISSPDGLVLELGPGTGPLTQEILNHGIKPDKLVLVERNENLANFMRKKFPDVRTIEGDASELDKILPPETIGEFTDVVSGLPLLTIPRDICRAIMQQSFAVMKPGGRFIQFSYGLLPPFSPKHLNLNVRLAGRVWENIPPVTVWVYEKSDESEAAA
jgi:phosphatidylethanolamine/phosphatidyl-N-methylethanolamine N-methyltransferase